jgi:hypothetical protein
MATPLCWRSLAQDWMTGQHQWRTFGIGTLTAVAFLLLAIGAFLVPRVLHSQVTAGEDAAIAALINISEAQSAYRFRYAAVGFAADLASLAVSRSKECVPSPQQACMLEYDLARNHGRAFRGYYFATTAGEGSPRTTYTVISVPSMYGKTGVRSFCVVERGVPRYKDFGREMPAQAITREQCLRDFTPLP